MIRNLLLCLAALFVLSSCIEYRWNRHGEERYISTVPIKNRNLDPKAGSKAKLWLVTEGKWRPYLGGDVRDTQYITGTIGLMVVPSPTLSFEVGWRTLLYQNDDFKRYEEHDRFDPWDDAPRMVYFGGVLLF